jgi:hypothetical protein
MRGRHTLALAIATLACAAPAAADPGSLYTGPGPRPGPDILYEPVADAPQLDNSGIWKAPPILISGAAAYRDGEYLYQDYIYDDHGAKAQADLSDPRRDPGGNSADGDLFSFPNGTYTYPTDPVYANNAADLVELRVKPLADATAFRITLNTLENPNLVASTIAIGGTPGQSVAWPHGANVRAPGALFLTVHGATADLLDADGNRIGAVAPPVSIDMLRRQIEVLVPHSDWDPGAGVVRLAAGVGLWRNGSYLIPGSSATATTPGGAGGLSNPPTFFNVAFRFREPFPQAASSGSLNDPAWWRDQDQGHSLASGDISSLYANVDFGKLERGTDDESAVPQSGAMDRILPSHFETEQGADYSVACGVADACKGELRGRLQPYAIYVPAGPPPAQGYGLTLLLHSLSASYNQFEGSNNQSQFAHRGQGSIVITPEGRGPDGWYYDQAGADTFEVWADVAARYHLDPAFTDIAGYSMGGYGTYKFATQFPDLFARAQPTVGPPALGIWAPPLPPTGGASTNTNSQLASLRNIPFLIWDETTDELVPYLGPFMQASSFAALGYRYEFDTFLAGDHLTLAINDQYAPAAAFLGTTTVDRNPPHVTYVYNPTMDFPADGTTAGHAYWVSGITLRNGEGKTPLGTIDVRSEGFGQGDPPASGVQLGGGALTGGNIPAIPYGSATVTWGPAPATPIRNQLDITARNVSAITIDAARAHVGCDAKLAVQSDGPLAVKLTDCGGTPAAAPSSKAVCVSRRLQRIRLPRGAHVLRIRITVGGRRARHVVARRLRNVLDLRRLPAGTVRVSIRLRVHGHARTLRRTYHTCATPAPHRKH